MALQAIRIALCLSGWLALAPLHAATTPLDSIIAVVNDDVITATDLERELSDVRQQLRQQNTPLPPAEVLRKQVLDRMVSKRIQLQLADANHIKIDDEALNRAILNIAAQNKLTLTELREALVQEGFSYEAYRENIRGEMTLAQLRQRQVVNRVVVTDQEVDEFLEAQAVQGSASEEYRLSHILIVVPESANVDTVDKAQRKANAVLAQLRGGADFAQLAVSESGGQQALQGGDLGWRRAGQLPTLFSGQATTMKVGEISDVIRSASGFHIIKLADKRTSEERHVVSQTHARHILIKTNELTSNDDARRKLEQLQARIQQGDDFAELARSHSDDTTNSAGGGDLGWVKPGDLVPAFEEVMNSLKANQLSTPFRTQFGWHLVEVLERRDYDDTEELLKSRARDQIRQRKIEEETVTWLRQLRDEAYVDIRN